MRMENIRGRVELGESNGNNYLVRGFNAMVRKVEENGSRVQMWLSIGAMVVTVALVFVPWLKNELVDSGRRQAQFEQIIEGQKKAEKASEEATKRLEAVEKKVDEVEKKVNTPKASRPKSQQAKVKPNLNGQADGLRATPPYRVEKVSGGNPNE